MQEEPKSNGRPPKSSQPENPDRLKRQQSLLLVTNRAIDRLCDITNDKELMNSIDIKDLKNLTSSVKELLCLSGELDGEAETGGVIFLPEVEMHGKE